MGIKKKRNLKTKRSYPPTPNMCVPQRGPCK